MAIIFTLNRSTQLHDGANLLLYYFVKLKKALLSALIFRSFFIVQAICAHVRELGAGRYYRSPDNEYCIF